MNGPQPAAEIKKGLSPLAWVGIGCAGLLLVGGVLATIAGIFVYGKVREAADDPVAAMAKVLDAANPDVELVQADKESRTVTFRDTRTGEELTFGYADLEAGRVTFSSGGETAEIAVDTTAEELRIETGEGTTTFRAGGELTDKPDWVPLYPGAAPQGTFSSETPEMRTGAFTFRTEDPLNDVLDRYAAAIEEAGLSIVSRTSANEGALLVAASSDERRGLQVIASTSGGPVEVVVNFTEKH